MVGVEVADEVARHRRVARRHRPTPQEDAMSATTIPASRAPALAHGLRIALVAAAIVVLLALSFVAGRATDTAAGSAPAVTPTTTAPVTTAPVTSAPVTSAPSVPATTKAAPAGSSVTPRSCHMVPDC
jgi:hypothetical protein